MPPGGCTCTRSRSSRLAHLHAAIGPALIVAAIGIGTGCSTDWLKLLPPARDGVHEWARLGGSVLLDWSRRSVLVGFVLACVAFLLSRAALSTSRPSRAIDIPE
jgi:hypothetical protein